MTTIFHLSDLHIVTSANWHSLHDCIINEAERVGSQRKKGEKLLVLTGDFRNFSDENYDNAEKFLKELFLSLGVEPSNDVFIVPGNHDVGNGTLMDRAFPRENWRRSQEGDVNWLKNHNNADGQYPDFVEDRLKSYKPYCDFVRRLNIYPKSKDTYLPARAHVRCWNKRLNILHLNTTLIADGSSKTGQQVDIRAATSSQIWDNADRSRPALALGHNSFYDLANDKEKRQDHQSALLSPFWNHGVCAYLCGDVHAEEIDRNRQLIRLDNGYNINGTFIPNVVGVKGTADENDHYSDYGLYLHEWDETSGWVNLTLRRWEERDPVAFSSSRVYNNSYRIIKKSREQETVRVQSAWIGKAGNGSVLDYCRQSGIIRMQDAGLDSSVFKEKLARKKEVYLIGTNHGGMISNNVTLFANLLARGADITILIAGKDSAFYSDVAAIESFPHEKSMNLWKQETDIQMNRLNSVFVAVQANLKRIYFDAKQLARKTQRPLGRLFLGNAFTLIRQTIIMGVGDEDNSLWAWVSVTLPPKRAADGTMSFEVETAMNDGDDKYRSMAENLLEHARAMRSIAEKRNALIEITDNSEIIDTFPGESAYNAREKDTTNPLQAVRAEWEDCAREAKKNMEERSDFSDCVLIEIAAQHPLKGGEKPGKDFAARLDEGIHLYKKLTGEGKKCKIYVPGSLHSGDNVSLSSAGIQYLVASGEIPRNNIFDEETNTRIKGESGVYNSADECYVASSLFKEGNYGRLICVCSANQMLRKKLFYYRFGVVPEMRTVQDDTFHSDMGEIFEVIPSVLLKDHDWQAEDSVHAIRTREERMPNYISPLKIAKI